MMKMPYFMDSLREFFIKDIFSSYHRTIGLFTIALLAIAIPITHTPVQNEQDTRRFAQTVAPYALSCKQPDPIDCKVHLAVPPREYLDKITANLIFTGRQGQDGKLLFCAAIQYDDNDLVLPDQTVNDYDIYRNTKTCVSSFRLRVHYAGSDNFITTYGQNGGRSKWNYMMAEVKAGMTDFGITHTYDEDMDFIANYLFGMSFAQLQASEEKNGCSMDSWDFVCRSKDGTGNDKTLYAGCKNRSTECLNHQLTDLSMDNPPKMVCEDYPTPAKSDKSTPALAPPAEIPENRECLVPLAVPPQGVSEISNTREYCGNRADDIYNGDSKCRVDFRLRVNYIFDNQYQTFKTPFSFFAAKVAWNYLMAEVKTGYTDFGDVNSYQSDLDYASQKFFGKTFSQLRADERANGCRMDSWRFVCRNDSGPKFTSGSDSGKVKDGLRFAGCRLASTCLDHNQANLSNDNPPRMICSNYRPTCECTDLPIVCEIKAEATSNTSLNSIINVVSGDLCGYDRVNWFLDGELKGVAPIDEYVLFQSLENGSNHSVKGQIFSSYGAREAVECGVTSVKLPFDETPGGSVPTPPGGGRGTCQVHLAVPPPNISIIDRRNRNITDPSKWFPEYCQDRAKDVMESSITCRSGFRERVGYVSKFLQYGDNGKRVKWNYIMSEVRTGYTDFGLANSYESDLDFISTQLFGMPFAQLSVLEGQAGCSMDSFDWVCRTSTGAKNDNYLFAGCSGSVCDGLSTGVPPDKPPKMTCSNYVGGSVISAQNIQPTLTPQPAPTADPAGMAVQVNVQVPAIGTDPATGQRLVYNPSVTATVQVFSSATGFGLVQQAFAQSGQPIKEVSGLLTFNGTIFSGIINLGTDLPSGQPLSFSVKLNNTLSKVIPINGILTIGETVNLPLVTLTPGDVNNDNTLSIQDWNSYVACFGSKTCSEKVASDLNYDGTVDIIDGNLLLRSLGQ